MPSEIFGFQEVVVNYFETEHFCEILSEGKNTTQ